MPIAGGYIWWIHEAKFDSPLWVGMVSEDWGCTPYKNAVVGCMHIQPLRVKIL